MVGSVRSAGVDIAERTKCRKCDGRRKPASGFMHANLKPERETELNVCSSLVLFLRLAHRDGYHLMDWHHPLG